MDRLSFSLLEILAVLGMVQCVYLLVHIIFSRRNLIKSILPILYFAGLGVVFTVEFAHGHIEFSEHFYWKLQWFLWFSLPPLSYLLCLQLADMSKLPSIRNFWVLLMLPMTYAITKLDLQIFGNCSPEKLCQAKIDLLNISGLLIGAISLLTIFSRKDIFLNLGKQKFGRQRYWLILSLIILNACFLFTVLSYMAGHIEIQQATVLKNVFGLGFVYLVGTTFLRVIPKNVKPMSKGDNEALTVEEQKVAERIEQLLDLDKVYQEPTYSRADLAKECNLSETVISRVINVHFKKSFPQIMNERRIEDAKLLLKETDANIKIISQDVGFNSLPSFNRVFKELTGYAPSVYRKTS